MYVSDNRWSRNVTQGNMSVCTSSLQSSLKVFIWFGFFIFIQICYNNNFWCFVFNFTKVNYEEDFYNEKCCFAIWIPVCILAPYFVMHNFIHMWIFVYVAFWHCKSLNPRLKVIQNIYYNKTIWSAQKILLRWFILCFNKILIRLP